MHITTLLVTVISPETVVYAGEASSLVVPAWDGKVGVLPGHAPFLTLLGQGELTVKVPGRPLRRFYVAGGILKVEGGEATVLTEYAGTEPPGYVPPGTVLEPEDVAQAVAGEAP